MWSPMVELLADRDLRTGAKTNWDVLPQFQVTLNRRQHIRANVGVRVPASNREGRSAQVVFYLLWDWFDGGLSGGLEMRRRLLGLALVGVASVALTAERPKKREPEFQTSDRCLACHNGLQSPSGEDVSIGFAWRASMMANSSRDPYWQASVRRETIDHPEAKAEIEDECSVCHMPITRYEAKLGGKKGEVFAHLPFDQDEKDGRKAQDGVSCSVCHQIGKEKLGTRESFNGGFVVDPPDSDDNRPEYGPFEIEKGHTRIMRTSTEGYHPTKNDHIRKSELCATCHTLYTKALGPGRQGDRRTAGADALPGVAAQRLQGQAELPVLPHAGDPGAGADHAGARRAARRRRRGTRSWRPISSCCGC